MGASANGQLPYPCSRRIASAAGHKFEAMLTAEHVFTASRALTTACPVQDNFGAEAIRTLTLEVN
jgi:hypothetical protein